MKVICGRFVLKTRSVLVSYRAWRSPVLAGSLIASFLSGHGAAHHASRLAPEAPAGMERTADIPASSVRSW